MEFRSQRKLRRCKLKDRKFTSCDFTAFFTNNVQLWSDYFFPSLFLDNVF